MNSPKTIKDLTQSRARISFRAAIAMCATLFAAQAFAASPEWFVEDAREGDKRIRYVTGGADLSRRTHTLDQIVVLPMRKYPIPGGSFTVVAADTIQAWIMFDPATKTTTALYWPYEVLLAKPYAVNIVLKAQAILACGNNSYIWGFGPETTALANYRALSSVQGCVGNKSVPNGYLGWFSAENRM